MGRCNRLFNYKLLIIILLHYILSMIKKCNYNASDALSEQVFHPRSQKEPIVFLFPIIPIIFAEKNKAMNKLTSFLFVCILVCGCTSSPYGERLVALEELSETHPDSTLRMLETIPVSELNEGEERAMYYLLTTKTLYKLGRPVDGDSLIDYCIDYFSKAGSTYHLANAHYYKGMVCYQLGRKDEAIVRLKDAERLAKKDTSELLRNKVYENLFKVNYDAHNFELSLDYAHLFLNSSKLMEDRELVCRALGHLSVTNHILGRRDSEHYYQNKCMAMMEDSDEQAPYYYTNYANNLIDNGEFAEAKVWLLKAMNIKPTASQYYLMGRVMQHEGDTMGARKSWEKVLEFGKIKNAIEAYRSLADLHFSRGDYKRAFEAQKLADSTYYEYGLQIRTTRLNDVQRRYDLMTDEKAAVESRERWLLLAVFAMGGLLFVMAVALFYLLRARKYRGALEKQTAINDQSQKEIQHLQSEEQAQRKEAIAHKEQIQMMKNASSERLGRGRKLYETINNGGKPGRFTTTDEKNFVHYYIYTFSEQYDEISRPYQSLTLRLKTFLILQQMGKDNKEMQRLLDIKESTIRSYRYWLSLRKK